MTETEFLLTISIRYQADSDENKETSVSELLVDPIQNSPNYHYRNCLADSKENYSDKKSREVPLKKLSALILLLLKLKKL